MGVEKDVVVPGPVPVVNTSYLLKDVVDWSEFNVWCFQLCDLHQGQFVDGHLSLSKASGISRASDCGVAIISPMRRKLSTMVRAGRFLSKPQVSKTTNGTFFTAYSGFAGGALGGGTATYLTHWLDTVKVKMQTFPKEHTSAYQCLKSTVKSEGFRGLYQGATPAVFGQMCKTATVFMSYSVCEELVRKTTGCSQVEDLTIWHHASSGAMTGVVASFVLCPMELVKCRKQALSMNPAMPRCSPLQIAGFALKNEGIRGLYRGLPGIWTKEIPGSFIYFGSYELAKSGMKHLNETPHLSSRATFLCGVVAGICFCVTHPIESVKTRVQVMSAMTSQQSGFLKSFINIVRSEGWAPLMSGLRPCMLRAGLYSGIQFVMYEYVKEHLIQHHNKS